MKVAMTVSGKVQGVGFRYMTKIAADDIGVFGIVKNLENGNVYIEAMGEEDKVTAFIEVIKKSPAPFGKVNHIDFEYNPSFKDYTKFSVTY